MIHIVPNLEFQVIDALRQGWIPFCSTKIHQQHLRRILISTVSTVCFIYVFSCFRKISDDLIRDYKRKVEFLKNIVKADEVVRIRDFVENTV